MSTDGETTAAHSRRVVLLAALLSLASLLALCSSAAALSFPVRHDCRAAPPGRAACMAMRLLLEQQQRRPHRRQALRGRAADVRQSASRTKPEPGYLTPELLHAAYQLPDETAASHTQTIAVIDAFDDPTIEADLGVYDEQFGLPACTTANGCFEKVNEQGNASPLPEAEGGWASEISIDVEMSHAICQNCHILLVEANTEEFSDLAASVQTAVRAGASEISNSYGGAESSSLEGLAADYDHPGLLISASSGDCGYLNKSCHESSGTNFPADSPDVLAVGGTSLTESGGTWRSTLWSDGGSGCSKIFSAPPWQAEVASFSTVGCGTGRAVADVSAIANPNTGVDIYDSTPEERGEETGWGVWGGTSVASPIVAAEDALAGGAGGVPYPAQTIYAHAGQASALYDVTSGTNGSCGNLYICRARAGYDGPSGLGSPIGLEAFASTGSPVSTSAPTITGTPEQGQTLTEHAGAWEGSPDELSYQWERCTSAGQDCIPIASATASTYTLAAADVAASIRVRETARNSHGSAGAYSTPTGPVSSSTPTITGFSPASGITGSTTVVSGTALSTTSAVLVDGLTASFAVLSPTSLEVTIPNGTGTGKVSVTTAKGSATSKTKFTATLSIESFKPATAAAGSVVTIKGVGFTRSSTVAFDGTPAAKATISGSTTIKATVPAGASAGRITVTNTLAPVGTVSSASSFTP